MGKSRAWRRVGAVLCTLLVTVGFGVVGSEPAWAAPPPNDDFAQAQLLTGQSGLISTTATGGTFEEGERISDTYLIGTGSVWYRIVPTADGTLSITNTGGPTDNFAVSTGQTVATQTYLTTMELCFCTPNSYATRNVPVVAGTTYYVSVMLADTEAIPHAIELQWTLAAPEGDQFFPGRVLTGDSGRVTGTTAHALADPIADFSAFVVSPLLGSHDVWFTWTPPADGTLRLSTAGSSFDTLLQVGRYVGQPRGAYLDVLANGDDSGTSVQSKLDVEVAVDLERGEPVRIGLTGQDRASGTYVLQWSFEPPAGDDFASPEVVTGVSGSVGGTTVGATSEPGERPRSVGTQARHTRWYSWTSPLTGPATITATSATFDPAVSVWTGTSLDDIVVQAADDDGGPGATAALATFPATAGTTYRISVDSEQSLQRGAYTLGWSVTAGSVPTTTTTTTLPPTTTTTTTTTAPSTTTTSTTVAPPTTTTTTAPPATASGDDDVPDGAARFLPVAPTRVLDTRVGLGAAAAPVGSGATIDLTVAGQAGVPAGAVAVAMNVTATNATGAGYVTVWPSGRARPEASTLNVERAGQTIPNFVVVPLAAGRVSLYAQTATDLLADVTGYWLPSGATTAGRFVPLQPARILDTRDGNGAPAGPVAGGSDVDLAVTGRGGVPPSGVEAVVLNVTATGTTGAGFVTVWPGGPRPEVSNLNIETAGQTIPNLVVVPLGPGGHVRLHPQSTTHLVADVAGYVTDGSAPSDTAGLFVPLVPARLLDTRTRAQHGGLFGAAEVVGGVRADLVVAGNRNVPSEGVAAVVANVTATNTAAPGFVTVHPAGTAAPNASNLNVDHAGQTIANLTMARLGHAGRVSLSSQAALDLVVDVAGYFTGAPAAAEPGVPLEPPAAVSGPVPASNPGDAVNCGDFAAWPAAQAWFDLYAPAYGDVARLDIDGDGVACEGLPGAP